MGDDIDLTSPLLTSPPEPCRLVVTNRPVNITLLHHVTTSCVFRRNSIYRGGIDARYGVEAPRGETRMSLCQWYSTVVPYRRMIDSTSEFSRMQLM
jgi:hypothetical protein